MKRKDHNGIISFWKFMFSLMILALHSGSNYQYVKYHFGAGSIGVEFFFIVSGFLFCKKCLNYKNVDNINIGKENISFILKKIKRFLPYILFLIIISIPFSFIFLKYRVYEYTISLYNILLIPAENGIHFDIYGILWYIIVMLVVQFFLFPIIIRFRDNYVNYISPVIVFLLGGYLLSKYNFVSYPWSVDIFTYKCVIRGLFVMNIGISIYPLVEKMKVIKLTDFSRFIITMLEIIGYSSIFIIVNMDNAHTVYGFLCLIIMTISVIISFSNHSLMQGLLNNKLSYFLEKISLPIYINQWLLIYIMNYYLDVNSIYLPYYKFFIVALLISIILSILEIFIIELIKKNSCKFKKIFINE